MDEQTCRCLPMTQLYKFDRNKFRKFFIPGQGPQTKINSSHANTSRHKKNIIKKHNFNFSFTSPFRRYIQTHITKINVLIKYFNTA